MNENDYYYVDDADDYNYDYVDYENVDSDYYYHDNDDGDDDYNYGCD